MGSIGNEPHHSFRMGMARADGLNQPRDVGLAVADLLREIHARTPRPAWQRVLTEVVNEEFTGHDSNSFALGNSEDSIGFVETVLEQHIDRLWTDDWTDDEQDRDDADLEPDEGEGEVAGWPRPRWPRPPPRWPSGGAEPDEMVEHAFTLIQEASVAASETTYSPSVRELLALALERAEMEERAAASAALAADFAEAAAAEAAESASKGSAARLGAPARGHQGAAAVAASRAEAGEPSAAETPPEAESASVSNEGKD